MIKVLGGYNSLWVILWRHFAISACGFLLEMVAISFDCYVELFAFRSFWVLTATILSSCLTVAFTMAKMCMVLSGYLVVGWYFQNLFECSMSSHWV